MKLMMQKWSADDIKDCMLWVACIVLMLCVAFLTVTIQNQRKQITSIELERERLEKELELIGAERAANAAELRAAENKLAKLQRSNDKKVREAAYNAVKEYDDMCGQDIADAFFSYLADVRSRNEQRRDANTLDGK